MNLCKYRHIFGKEREGIHKYRIFNIAIVDLGLTILGAILIAYLWKRPFLIVLTVLLIVSVLVHRVFCVETTLTNLVFLRKSLP